MMVTEKRFGFRKAFVMHDTDLALQVVRDKHRYARIQIISFSPLELPGFRMRRRRTGVIKLGASIEEVFASFDRTTRNNIHRAGRDPGLRFQFSPTVTEDGYSLVARFVRARGLTPHSRSYYEGCVEFLAYADDKPVSGVFLFPNTPIGLLGAVFSKRHEDCSVTEYKRISYASKRLMADVCEWGISHGMTEIDMGGLNLDATEKAGIASSKMAYSPIVAEQYVYTYDSPIFRIGERLMATYRATQRLVRRAMRKFP
jgi:lipid II:glycine glycyltransferase (peptidoglycan interpeptide bridge formation enzyme)